MYLGLYLNLDFRAEFCVSLRAAPEPYGLQGGFSRNANQVLGDAAKPLVFLLSVGRALELRTGLSPRHRNADAPRGGAQDMRRVWFCFVASAPSPLHILERDSADTVRLGLWNGTNTP